MSLEIIVYSKEVSKDLIPHLMKRLNNYDMETEIHPDFKFDQETDSGFLPFKFMLHNPHLKILEGIELLSGFEIYIEDFDLKTLKESLKLRPGFFDKLLGRKETEVSLAAPETEKKLKDCKKAIHFVWHAGNSFQLRFASLTSAILTELTNGVCTYPADDIWYDNEGIVDDAFKEIKDYEHTLTEKNIEFTEFRNW
jgi:hypothetical protein